MELTSKIVVRPFGQKLSILPIGTQTVTKGGIHIPDSAQNKPMMLARVLAIGDGHEDSSYSGKWPPPGIKRGTLLIVGRFAGVEIPLTDRPETQWPRVINVAEILGVVVSPRGSNGKSAQLSMGRPPASS